MICNDIQRLIDYSVKNGLIDKEDEIVIRNMLMDALHVYDFSLDDYEYDDASIDDILKPLVEYAVGSSVIDDTTASRDLFDTKLMGIVTPLPCEMIRRFSVEYDKSPENATLWYYDISRKLNYVRAGRIEKDVKWKYSGSYGVLDITINKSKPEKDPRDIAAAGKSKAAGYPKCQLCVENMGFAGNTGHPARQNLRPVPLNINKSRWYLQYSPYGYYNEHCIVFNKEHIPMVIDETVFDKLFDFIEQFPHYFIGSNADLPIVGGSILSHEHFQGGNYTFAMAEADRENFFRLDRFPDVDCATLRWPMSVIRLSSKNREALKRACTSVLDKWRTYSDESAGIFAFTDGVPHNTVTPIARINQNGEYECDLVLRNNITSDERPLGVFHPGPELHHIKKENIGLIEVMGLAVLPSRLEDELSKVKKLMLSGADLTENEKTRSHADWAQKIMEKYDDINSDNIDMIIENEVGKVFEKVLEDAGVFKRDKKGKEAFLRFVETLDR